MSNESQQLEGIREDTQLTQVHVPLEQAADAFARRDDSGRIPIVVVPQRRMRIAVELVAIGGVILLAGILSGNFLQNVWLAPLGLVAGLVLLGLVVYNASRVIIPEGVNALLAQGGKYKRTIGSGLYLLPPWVIITHLVTRREIPFSVLIEDAPTSDNVRTTLNIVTTFGITDPFRFVYNISADDFDLVFQAACQNGLREMVRGITSLEINDLTRRDLSDIREQLSKQVEPYGVTIMKASITFAQPPADFVRSQEARKLAEFLQREQEEQHALAVRRQSDQDALARQQLLAQVEREREHLRAELEHAAMRKQIIELEAENSERRLALLEERLEKYPHAAQWEWQSEQLGVARALAANTRAMVQVGNPDGFLRGLLLQDTMPTANATPAPRPPTPAAVPSESADGMA